MPTKITYTDNKTGKQVTVLQESNVVKGYVIKNGKARKMYFLESIVFKLKRFIKKVIKNVRKKNNSKR